MVLAALATLLPSSAAQAQTATTLVSNDGQAGSSGAVFGVLAQRFTTGANSSGYRLTQIRLRLGPYFLFDRTTVVKLRENTVTSGDDRPGDVLATLTNPASFTYDALNTFTAPAGTVLEPETKYWVTVNEGDTDTIRFAETFADGQSGESGWTIADGRLAGDSTAWISVRSSLIMAVQGSVNSAGSATGTVSITGTATVRESLTATVTGAADPDGLTSPTYRYQWLRVDGDGTSNEAAVSGATASSYTLVAADAGKKIKVRRSPSATTTATSRLLTSAAYPASATVAPAAPGAPTGLMAAASGDSQIDLSWTAPTDTGGPPITGYRIEWSPDGTTGWEDLVADTAGVATTPATPHPSRAPPATTASRRSTASAPAQPPAPPTPPPI